MEPRKAAKENDNRHGMRRTRSRVAARPKFSQTQPCATQYGLKRKSRSDRVRAKVQEVKQELRRRMHETIDKQGAWLRQVVTGFNAYHAVPTNATALADFQFHVTNPWRRTLRWRGQKGGITWERMTVLQDGSLPRSRVTNPLVQRALRHQMPEVETRCRNPPAYICCG